MRILRDPDRLLAEGLAAIRAQFAVPPGFPDKVLAAAETAVSRHFEYRGRFPGLKFG